jgi:hypothetical protein
MTPAARTQLARDLYRAFADGDRELVESRPTDQLFEVFGLAMSFPPSHRSNRYEGEFNAKEVR